MHLRIGLLPALAQVPGVRLHTVATSRGMTAEHARSRHGFSRATTDIQEVLADPGIDAVLVATPPEQHASLVCQALAAGKAVFVEKPLALSRAELASIDEARRQASRFLTVGFNRRFAPLTQQARRRLEGCSGARVILIRVNAGPSDQRGRVLGEMCHFVDLARHLAGSAIQSVHATAATAASGSEDVTAILSFADGSIATILYTALGDVSFPKELIEVYAAGTIVRIDDFRSLSLVTDGRTTTERPRSGQDKGHKAEMAAFVGAVRGRGPAPINEDELIETSLATLAILESLQNGARVDL